MRIKRIVVTNLFGVFNQDFTLEDKGRVTIIYGMNGSGKTTVLRMLDALFHRDDHYLAMVQFNEMRLTLDDGVKESVVSVRSIGEYHIVPTENAIDEKSVPKRAAKLVYERFSEQESLNYTEQFPPPLRWDVERINTALADIAPGTQRLGQDTWRLAATNKVLTLEQIVAQFTLWNMTVNDNWTADVPWLRDLFPYGGSLFLTTQRLTVSGLTGALAQDIKALSSEGVGTAALETGLTVERESLRIKAQIAAARDLYSRVAEELDATFPQRVLERVTNDSTDPPKWEQLQKQLEGVTQRQEKLRVWGLLKQSVKTLGGSFSTTLHDEAMLKMLQVYAVDATQKLDAVSELEANISTFLQIMQEKLNLRNKQIFVTAEEGIRVTTEGGFKLMPAQLSSGEQHLLTMMCVLLFHTHPETLVLVDEPETSLHIAWQKEYITDMERLANAAGFYALIASHSPDIEQGRAEITRSFDPEVFTTDVEDTLEPYVEEADV